MERFQAEVSSLQFLISILGFAELVSPLDGKIIGDEGGKRITLHAEFGFVDRQRYLMVYC